MSCRTVFIAFFIALLLTASVSRSAVAADASLNGRVLDQLGAPIDMARVTLLRDGQRVSDTTSDPRGDFTFSSLAKGRYQVEAIAAGFAPRTSDAVFFSTGGRATIDVGLQVGAVTQYVIVTAAAAEVPQAQAGASVTVI